MTYYNSNQSLSAKGLFIGYLDGYATFHLENDDIIDFEQIDKKILKEYDLKMETIETKLSKFILQKFLRI